MNTSGAKIHLYSKREERLNTLSHGVAALLSLVMLVVMALKVYDKSLLIKASMLSFCVANCLVYISSTIYHGIRDINAKIVAQKIDHSMVSLIILGTAVPTLLVASQGRVANVMLVAVGIVTLLNVIANLVSVQKFKRISQALYLLGLLFIVVGIAVDKVALGVGFWSLFLLGVAVIVVGGYFYMQKSKDYTHFVWHIADITCTILHFCAFYFYLVK